MGKAAANSSPLKSKKWREEEEEEENRARTQRNILENRNIPVQELKDVSLTWSAEASTGVWVPGAGLGHLLIYTCNLQ